MDINSLKYTPEEFMKVLSLYKLSVAQLAGCELLAENPNDYFAKLAETNTARVKDLEERLLAIYESALV